VLIVEVIRSRDVDIIPPVWREDATPLLYGKGRWGPFASKSPIDAASPSCSSTPRDSYQRSHSSVTSTSYAIQQVCHTVHTVAMAKWVP